MGSTSDTKQELSRLNPIQERSAHDHDSPERYTPLQGDCAANHMGAAWLTSAYPHTHTRARLFLQIIPGYASLRPEG